MLKRLFTSFNSFLQIYRVENHLFITNIFDFFSVWQILAFLQQVSAKTDCSQFIVRPICQLPGKFFSEVDMTFYKKFVDANGIPILGSNDVDDYSFVESARVISGILQRLKPQLAEALLKKPQRAIIYGPNENNCIIPETTGEDCEPELGLGLSSANWIFFPALSCDTAENCWGYVVHEFGHAVNSVFDALDRNLQPRLEVYYLVNLIMC